MRSPGTSQATSSALRITLGHPIVMADLMTLAGYGHMHSLAKASDAYGNAVPTSDKWNERLEISLVPPEKKEQP